MESADQRVAKMLSINKKQKAFYEKIEIKTINDEENFIAKTWGKIRHRIHHDAAGDLRVWTDLYDKHWEWMGDLSDKSLLDLGCYIGNPLSLQIAEKSGDYFAIDLSEKAINVYKDTLQKAKLKNARAEAVDFLSPAFQEKYKDHFDIVYAHSVAHHFEHFDVFLENLSNVLKPGGKVITFDPLQTSTLIKAVRKLYRPFQSDRHWEWPFDRKSFDTIQQYFAIDGVRGTMGNAKWAIPIYLFSRKLGVKLGKKWHERDKRETTQIGPGLWKCLHVSMCWKKKEKN